MLESARVTLAGRWFCAIAVAASYGFAHRGVDPACQSFGIFGSSDEFCGGALAFWDVVL